MKTNTRFALIDTKRKTLTVYEDKIVLVIYNIEGPLTKEDVEAVRVQEYKDKA